MKLFFLLTLLLLISTNAYSTADGPDCWNVRGVAKNDVLNIRLSPNPKAKILGTIPPQAKSIKNSNDLECPDDPQAPQTKECKSGWCKVTYQSVTGWVNCKFLEGTSDCH